MNLLPPELKSKIQSYFDPESIYDFINYCSIDKKTKKFCIEEYKRILTKKGYTNIPSNKIIERTFNFLQYNQKNIPQGIINFVFFGGKLNMNDNIMFLFNKNIQLFDYFIKPEDNRYKKLFSSQFTRGHISSYIRINNNRDILKKSSINELQNELKKMKFILDHYNGSSQTNVSVQRRNYFTTLQIFGNHFKSLIERYIDNLKIEIKRKKDEIINKYMLIATPAIIAAGTAAGIVGTVKLGRIIGKKFYSKKNKILKNKLRNSKKTKKVSKTN